MRFEVVIYDALGLNVFEIETYRTSKESPTKQDVIQSIRERVSYLMMETDTLPMQFTFVGGSAHLKINKT